MRPLPTHPQTDMPWGQERRKPLAEAVRLAGEFLAAAAAPRVGYQRRLHDGPSKAMSLSILNLLDSLGRSTTEREIADTFNLAIKEFGFRWGTAVALEEQPGSTSFQGIELQVFEEHAPSLVHERPGPTLDVVLKHVTRTSLLGVWDAALYQHAGQGELYVAMSEYGLEQGVCLALRLPHGRNFIVSFDVDRSIRRDAASLAPVIAQVQLFAIHLHEAAWVRSEGASLDESPLTQDEVQVLQWTLAGKTANEVGKLLNMTEASVAKYGHLAATKLGCAGKHQAAARALHLGWIPL